MEAPTTITTAESTAVKRTPILSRIIPAKIRKKANTFRKYSDPATDPKVSGVHFRLCSSIVLNGASTSINI